MQNCVSQQEMTAAADNKYFQIALLHGAALLHTENKQYRDFHHIAPVFLSLALVVVGSLVSFDWRNKFLIKCVQFIGSKEP